MDAAWLTLALILLSILVSAATGIPYRSSEDAGSDK